jgi:hypothetical protein
VVGTIGQVFSSVSEKDEHGFAARSKEGNVPADC